MVVVVAAAMRAAVVATVEMAVPGAVSLGVTGTLWWRRTMLLVLLVQSSEMKRELEVEHPPVYAATDLAEAVATVETEEPRG